MLALSLLPPKVPTPTTTTQTKYIPSPTLMKTALAPTQPIKTVSLYPTNAPGGAGGVPTYTPLPSYVTDRLPAPAAPSSTPTATWIAVGGAAVLFLIFMFKR